MKLRTFARFARVRYETAWRWLKAKRIQGRQLDTGTIIITEDVDQQEKIVQELNAQAQKSSSEETVEASAASEAVLQPIL